MSVQSSRNHEACNPRSVTRKVDWRASIGCIWISERQLTKRSISVQTLGGDNNINVAIANYKPNVKCDSTSTTGPAWNSCVQVFGNMRASKKFRVFGSAEDPGVEEILPLGLEGGKRAEPVNHFAPGQRTAQLIFSLPFSSRIADRKCQLSIDIDGPATIALWYELWEATTAIATMCVRAKSKGGKAKGLGKQTSIHPTYFLQNPPPTPIRSPRGR